jgi:hypothetical protein
MLRLAVVATLFTAGSVAFAVTPSRTVISVSGTYKSNWDDVTLTQDGSQVFGTYVCCGGGTIRGYINGRTLHYEWHQPGGSGRGVWTIHPPGKLDGTWGVGTSTSDGGRWDLVRK